MLALCGASAVAAPFPSSDPNPLLAGFALTAPARLQSNGQSSAQIAIEWSSTAVVQQTGNEALTVDAESRELRLGLQRAFGERFEARIQLPYRTTGGGSLDGPIESWHDFFGLPNGPRASLPRGRLNIDYRRNGITVVKIADTDLSGAGDIALDFGYRLQDAATRATSLWAGVLLPTGDEDKLTGNGAVGGSLAVAHTQKLHDRFELFGHVAVHLRGSGEILESQRKSLVWSAMAGTDYRATSRLTITAQFDSHSATFNDTGLDLLGAAHIFTFGGDYAWPSGWRLQVSVAEDVKVEASPDVTFALTLRKALGARL